MTDIKIRWDIDGVHADFAGRVEREMGVHPDSAAIDRSAMWDWIARTSDFWETLPVLPGAQEMWTYTKQYQSSFLTGVGSNPEDSKRGKRLWTQNVFGSDRVVITGNGRKSEFCRPGDILIDDMQANIDQWHKAGGLGVLHTDYKTTLAELKELGVLGNGEFSNDLIEKIAGLREDRSLFRSGYTGYVISPKSQRELVNLFGVRKGVSENYRLVCAHITSSFPAGLDTVDDAQPNVRVVGEFTDDNTGHHVLVCTVNNQILRDDGKPYHITYALDNGTESAGARKQAGGKSPTAGESNKLLQKVLEGGAEQLFNLSADQQLEISVDFALLDQEKMARLPKPKTPETEEVFTFPVIFEQGMIDFDGNQVKEGTRTERLKGENLTVTHSILINGKNLLHCENAPAIERKHAISGRIFYQAWYLAGKQVQENDLVPSNYKP